MQKVWYTASSFSSEKAFGFSAFTWKNVFRAPQVIRMNWNSR
jgi:hypothetical protein